MNMRQYSYGRDNALIDALTAGDDGSEKVAGPLAGAAAGALVGGTGGYFMGDERGAVAGALGGAGLGAGGALMLRGSRLRGIGKEKGVFARDLDSALKDYVPKKDLTADDVLKLRSGRAYKSGKLGLGESRTYSDASYKGKGAGEYTVTQGKTKTKHTKVDYDNMPSAARESFIRGEPVTEIARGLSDDVAEKVTSAGTRRMLYGAGAGLGGVGAGILVSRGGREKRAAAPEGSVEVGGKYYRPKVQAFMYDPEGRILAARSQGAGGKLRAYDNYKFPGGGIEPGEDAVEAAKKELLEEAGYETGGDLYEFGTPTPVDWDEKFREQARAKGRGDYHGQYERYVAGPIGKRNTSKFGSEGDQLGGLEFVERERLRRDLARTASDPDNEYAYFDKQKLVALEALEEEMARRKMSKTASLTTATVAGGLSGSLAGTTRVLMARERVKRAYNLSEEQMRVIDRDLGVDASLVGQNMAAIGVRPYGKNDDRFGPMGYGALAGGAAGALGHPGLALVGTGAGFLAPGKLVRAYEERAREMSKTASIASAALTGAVWGSLTSTVRVLKARERVRREYRLSEEQMRAIDRELGVDASFTGQSMAGAGLSPYGKGGERYAPGGYGALVGAGVGAMGGQGVLSGALTGAVAVSKLVRAYEERARAMASRGRRR
jgi:8-oxo-dGTP pyrophosphatase MutT (NUDIX family)/uncharacterized integral membrane protein